MKKVNVESRTPSLFAALLPVFVLIGLLGVNVYLYGEDSSYGPNQIALLLAAASATLVGLVLKISFKQMIRLDIKYILNQSLLLDVKILLLTIPTVMAEIRQGLFR